MGEPRELWAVETEGRVARTDIDVHPTKHLAERRAKSQDPLYPKEKRVVRYVPEDDARASSTGWVP